MRYAFTPENITELEEDEIFAFGSNLGGRHSGGAARFAKENFDAQEGVGEGLTGKCYAFPTLGSNFEKRSDGQLTMSVEKLFKCAKENPNKTFLLTRVGMGIANYGISEIAPLFKDSPRNVIKPRGW
jgi:hypothetical protein